MAGLLISGRDEYGCPAVAGVDALIIGKNGGSMHPDQVKAALRQSADDLGKPGKDKFPLIRAFFDPISYNWR